MLKTILSLSLLLALILTSAQAQESERCVYLKRSRYTKERSMNLVFVPSGFGNDMAAFEAAIREKWPTIASFEPFSDQVDSLNVIIAKNPHRSNSLCHQHRRIERVFECNGNRGRSLADVCMPNTNRHVMIINNSSIYGANGKSWTSNVNIGNQWAARQMVHELGHAMFRLRDEYADRHASSVGSNCTGDRNCGRWQDLINAGMATCRPGCEGNRSYTSGTTIMDVLESNSFGHVNTRLICCTFKNKTGAFPPLCNPYRNIGRGLENFCR